MIFSAKFFVRDVPREMLHAISTALLKKFRSKSENVRLKNLRDCTLSSQSFSQNNSTTRQKKSDNPAEIVLYQVRKCFLQNQNVFFLAH